MLKGLYAAASSMVANLERQTVLTHNATNLTTPGFKQLLIAMEDWKETGVFPRVNKQVKLPFLPSVYENLTLQQVRHIGNLGLGTDTTPEEVDFTQGALLNTGETFDVAIEGEGFFYVQTPDGNRYTRDGRFNRDSAGNLVTVDGYKVLDEGGAPIVLAQGETYIDGNGSIVVDGVRVAKLGFFNFADPKLDLVRDGPNLFEAVGTPTAEKLGRIRQGAIEASNVSIAEVTTQMLLVGRAYEAAQQLVTVQDSLLGRAITTLGQF